MITREIKIRIFAEYLYCIATDGANEIQVTPSNIEKLVDNGFKLKLKSVYDLTKEEMFEIAEEMRYYWYFDEVFTNFREDGFYVTSESRNKRTLDTAMIYYVAITKDGLKGNWFKLSTSLGVQNLKAKGYDVGSPYSFVDYNNYIRRVSLEEIGLAVII